eukprot:scaffold10030_cov67-Skeletonema_dohrnii-CCMP3373.AAC.1
MGTFSAMVERENATPSPPVNKAIINIQIIVINTLIRLCFHHGSSGSIGVASYTVSRPPGVMVATAAVKVNERRQAKTPVPVRANRRLDLVRFDGPNHFVHVEGYCRLAVSGAAML